MVKFIHPKEVEKQITSFLKRNGSKSVQKKMLEKNGIEFCISYMQDKIRQNNLSMTEALEWLQEDLVE